MGKLIKGIFNNISIQNQEIEKAIDKELKKNNIFNISKFILFICYMGFIVIIIVNLIF